MTYGQRRMLMVVIGLLMTAQGLFSFRALIMADSAGGSMYSDFARQWSGGIKAIGLLSCLLEAGLGLLVVFNTGKWIAFIFLLVLTVLSFITMLPVPALLSLALALGVKFGDPQASCGSGL